MKQPLISIVTPSYNQGKYIEHTIQSVLSQTYKNIEYIILDSCSNDETIEILEKYKANPNIKIIIEKDKGQTDAINKGFRMAKGELIGWINSDDLLKPKCVENIVNSYKNNNEGVIFYGDLDEIDEQGKYLHTSKSNVINYNYLLNTNPNVTQPGSFYKRKVVEDVGYLDETINYTMDYDLWLKLLTKGKAIYCNFVLGEFRLQLNSKTMTKGSGIKFWKDIFYIRKKHNAKILSRIHLRFICWVIEGICNRIKKRYKNSKNIYQLLNYKQ